MDIVLIEPQIPQNTGSIARSCAATKTPLHLVGKLGFEISEKNVRRAGLDYWPHVDLHQHESWERYLETAKPGKVWVFSKYAKKHYYEAKFSEHDALVFGGEVKGLGKEFIARYQDSALLIPIACPAVRSLNLSNAVSIALYEARRQLGLDSKLREFSGTPVGSLDSTNDSLA